MSYDENVTLRVLILESLRLTHYLSTGLWPHCFVDSRAARYCDSELRLTVQYCAL